MDQDASTEDADLLVGEVQRVDASTDAPADLSNWQEPDQLRWAFQHMDEVMPTQVIAAGTEAPRPLAEDTRSLGELDLVRFDGSTGTLDDVLAETHTDAFIVLHEGRVVEERYLGAMTPSTRHLVMSVSKSIVGCVAGGLVEAGALDPEAAVTSYLPEVAGSGYDGATVRNVLDMRTGVAFRETYTDPDAEVRVMERSMGWSPLEPDDPVGAYAYLATLGRDGPHDGRFTYRSADTDLLGWLCERVTGVPMADLISERIWGPIGAEFDATVTTDWVGTAIHDGGISATARDLARFGQMLLDEGVVDGRRVVPASWIEESFNPGHDVRQAFAESPDETVLPGAWYRNQFWFIPGIAGDNLVCLGIHGQMIHVSPATRTVAVKLSSWPSAQHLAHLIDTLRAVGRVGAYLYLSQGDWAAGEASASTA
ncbi:MAG: beta-lactamase family protein [Micrococcales bacterium]|nr:beta-lactamase family protein [Micrococcales bacterium]